MPRLNEFKRIWLSQLREGDYFFMYGYWFRALQDAMIEQPSGHWFVLGDCEAEQKFKPCGVFQKGTTLRYTFSKDLKVVKGEVK